ncbi:MAG TPA: peptidyl-tRNA hydrolase [Acidilobales archaeon]|nr:peptidyl-tRNA hydrolase [Acidilobales archaeon]
MSKGKLATQVAHAAVEAFIKASKRRGEWVDEWLRQGQKKVVLKVSSLGELMEVYEKAKLLDLPTCIIADAGRTELPPGTITAVGIGPAPSHIIDKVTGRLKTL